MIDSQKALVRPRILFQIYIYPYNYLKKIFCQNLSTSNPHEKKRIPDFPGKRETAIGKCVYNRI